MKIILHMLESLVLKYFSVMLSFLYISQFLRIIFFLNKILLVQSLRLHELNFRVFLFYDWVLNAFLFLLCFVKGVEMTAELFTVPQF